MVCISLIYDKISRLFSSYTAIFPTLHTKRLERPSAKGFRCVELFLRPHITPTLPPHLHHIFPKCGGCVGSVWRLELTPTPFKAFVHRHSEHFVWSLTMIPFFYCQGSRWGRPKIKANGNALAGHYQCHWTYRRRNRPTIVGNFAYHTKTFTAAYPSRAGGSILMFNFNSFWQVHPRGLAANY